MLGGDGAPLPRRERTRGAGRRLDERQPQSVRIDEREHARPESRLDGLDAGAVLLEARSPVRQAAGRHFQPDLDGQAVAETRRRHLRPREKRQIRPGPPLRVRIEEVIGPGVVLIDALLHEPHAEHARVEIEVLLRGSGDGGDVMESVDAFVMRAARISTLCRAEAASH